MKTIIKKLVTTVATATVVLSTLTLSLSAHAGYTLPKYQKLKLDNGLTIYLMEQHEVPLIDVNLVVKAGAVQDGAKPGLNHMTIANMELATEQHTKTEIEEALDFIGADLGTLGGVELSTITSSFASKDQAKVLGIIRDIVISPRFDKNEFDKYKTRYMLRLEQQKESPRSVINTYFNKMIFGDHGYGSATGGDAKSVQSILLKDLKAFHKTWYQPKNSAVVVTGDFDSKSMLIRLKALFSGWKNGEKAQFDQPTLAKNFKKSNVLLVDKSDASETRFLIGGKGVKRANPDFVAISVINTILGGRFTSWLNDELRVNAGLTYGARSSFDTFGRSGTFSISTFTKTSTTVEAIDLALKTYNRLWEKGVDEKTLASAKAYVKGQFPPKYETSTQLANLLVSMFGYGFDESFINGFEQQVNSLTTAKAKKIISQYFPKENLQFVLVGKAEDIKDKVSKYGQVKQVNIKDVGFKTH
jgi:zinc protease